MKTNIGIFNISSPRHKLNHIKPRSHFENYLIVYLKLSYYIGYAPFKVVQDKAGGYVAKTNVLQRFSCALLNISGFILRLAEFRHLTLDLFRTELYKNPTIYFRIAANFASISFQIAAFYRLWFHHQDYLNILNFASKNTHKIPKGSKLVQSQLFTCVTFILCICFAIHQVVYMYVVAPSFDNNQLGAQQLETIEKYVVFLVNATFKTSVSPTAKINWLDYGSAIFVVIGKCNSWIIGYICDLSLLLTALNLWSITYSFALTIKENLCLKLEDTSLNLNSSISWADIYEQYKAIRTLFQLVNRPFGTMITLYLADTILSQTISMDTIIVETDPVYRFRLAFFVFASFAVFILSSDSSHQLNAIHLWLQEDNRRKTVPFDELELVKYELESNAVGLRGSDVFTITYPIMWNIYSTVVTYFIICLQSRQASTSTLI